MTFFLVILAIESFTNIFSKSDLFAPARTDSLLGKLISCKYCMSVWMAIVPAAILEPIVHLGNPVLGYLVMWMLYHRSAYLLGILIDKFECRQPWFVIQKNVNSFGTVKPPPEI